MQPAYLLEDSKESSIGAGKQIDGAADLEIHEEEPVDFPHGQVLPQLIRLMCEFSKG